MAKYPDGHAGSWFAKWEGESLPCVHQHWTKGSWPEYVDPGYDARAEWGPFIEALKTGKKAILTTSHLPDDSGKRRRKSYIGVWYVSDVRITQDGELRFLFNGEPIHRFPPKRG